MASSRRNDPENAESTETTSLVGNVDSTYGSGTITPDSPNGDERNGKKVANSDEETSSDEEASQLVNPLFEGQSDMMAKMAMLFPAVSIGV